MSSSKPLARVTLVMLVTLVTLVTLGPRAARAQEVDSGDTLPTAPVNDPSPPASSARLGAAPPAYRYVPAPAPRHAPAYALWAGVRAGVSTFAGSFYEYQIEGRRPEHETTGNLVGPGFVGEADVGARLGRRYVPYVFYERGFLTRGRRFEGTDASLSTDFFGLGFRTTFGNVNDVGFTVDLALGMRVLRASGAASTWTMRTFEIARFGLGMEIRLSNAFVLSPLFSLSTGSMSSSRGTISYAPGSALDGPLYRNGADVDSSRVYLVASVGVGAHFDLFGK